MTKRENHQMDQKINTGLNSGNQSERKDSTSADISGKKQSTMSGSGAAPQGEKAQTQPKSGQADKSHSHATEAEHSVESDWIVDISHQANSLDQSLKSFINARPLTVTLCAVAVGLVGSLVMKTIAARRQSS
jgi:hypothetical protein